MKRDRYIEILVQSIKDECPNERNPTVQDIQRDLIEHEDRNVYKAILTAMQRAVEEETATLRAEVERLKMEVEVKDEAEFLAFMLVNIQRISEEKRDFLIKDLFVRYPHLNPLRAELERLKQSKSCVEIPKGTLQEGDVIVFEIQSRSVELFKLHSELNRLRAELERLKQCEAIVRELASSALYKGIDDDTSYYRNKSRQWVKENTTKTE